MIRAFAPGRVNLIGDHTDYTGGLVLPMAIDLGTTVEGHAAADAVTLSSAAMDGMARVPLDIDDPAAAVPEWARYVAGVVAVARPGMGFDGSVSSTLPLGAGLSSSAALEVAVALALGVRGTPVEVARMCQEAEQRASGVPCGIMDQLASTAGVVGHALLIDCDDLAVTPVPMPASLDVVVLHSGEPRALAGSAYAERRRSCEAAEAVIGPLNRATPADVERLDDHVLRARARHVVTENERVRQFAAALAADDRQECGRLMVESHRSLAIDFEVSTAGLDGLVASLCDRPGVYGARLTGAGFGGCVVAIAEPGALAVDRGWHVTAVDGASVSIDP